MILPDAGFKGPSQIHAEILPCANGLYVHLKVVYELTVKIRLLWLYRQEIYQSFRHLENHLISLLLLMVKIAYTHTVELGLMAHQATKELGTIL